MVFELTLVQAYFCPKVQRRVGATPLTCNVHIAIHRNNLCFYVCHTRYADYHRI